MMFKRRSPYLGGALRAHYKKKNKKKISEKNRWNFVCRTTQEANLF